MDEIGGRHALVEYGNWERVESVVEVIENIISRLPVKNLMLCKSVSTYWRRLISGPHFAKLQLVCSREHPNYIVFLHADDIGTNACLMEGNGEIGQTITLPGFEHICTPNIICSFNGLVCCTNAVSLSLEIVDLDIRICNPTTREVLVLPKGSPSTKEPSLGLFFGPQEIEYKVFRFFCKASKAEDEHYECEIYSSNTASWRGIGRVAPCPMVNHYCPLSSDHVFVSGELYWFISSEEEADTPGSILSVDQEENFRRISLPDEVTAWSFLINLQGSLSLVTVDESESIVDIWVLENSNESIWSLEASAEFYLGSNIECFNSVAARKNEIFFIIRDTLNLLHYLVYNLACETLRELDLTDTFEGYCPVVFPFTESLLPCKYQKLFLDI